MSDNNIASVVIIGGGLVGSLCAAFMAKRGYQVTLYERRDDIRKAKFSQGRSINLSLSHRGRKALRTIGLEELVLNAGLPMKGRLLHTLTGETKSVPYDPTSNQCIYSVGRNFLNKTLLEVIGSNPNVKLHFNHKLLSCHFAAGTINLLDTENNETIQVKGDLIIGADGAFSAMRRSMQQIPLFEFSQTYIEHGYLELGVPQTRGPQLQPNHLHIWPRGQFMMIALPNQDGSWTVTLFMPFAMFKSLETREKMLEFFQKTFPDALDMIGVDELVDDFFKNEPSTLVSIKCQPYHAGGNFLILGDAAHAMVPFYGQGMNAGFEDCTILNELLDKYQGNLEKTVQEFSKKRVQDAHAICDLAMYNYLEMRDLVTRPSYKLRKTLDDFLFRLFPELWIPLYNSVSFSNMGYTKCLENRNWQNKVIQKITMLISTSLAAAASYFVYKKFY